MMSVYVRASKFFETEEKDLKEEDYARIQGDTAIITLEMTFNIQLTEEKKKSRGPFT